MLLTRRFPGYAQPNVSRHLGFVTAIAIFAIGCRDDAYPAARATGLQRYQPAVSGSAAVSAFNSYQLMSSTFVIPSGFFLRLVSVTCPSGTQVTGGGVSALPSGQADYSVVESYPFFDNSTNIYFWKVTVFRDTAYVQRTDTLTAYAVCVS